MPPFGRTVPKRGPRGGARGVRPFPPPRRRLRGRPGALGGPTSRRLYAGGRRPGTCHSTLSRESVVDLIGSAWALVWRAACLGGLWGGASAPSRARSARLRLAILLCPEWPSARAVGKYHEQTCWDPKDGELCLARMKPEETLVEVRSNSDVQIDCQSWV